MVPDTPHGFGLLRISGEKAMSFLQGQLTCDVSALLPGKQQLAAHCNPQGRVISLFYLSLNDDGYELAMPLDMLEMTLNALKKYAVFFKVKMDIIPASTTDAAGAQDQHPIDHGIPFIHPATSAKFLPQELNLDALGAISYEKGCYTGQEIIARLHYRGKAKSRLHVIKVQCSQRPSPGTLIHTGTSAAPQECGMIIESRQSDLNTHIALAVIDDAQQNNTLFLGSPNETIILDSGK